MKTNQRKQGVLLSYITTVVNAVVGFLYVPILLNYMGQSEYGLYQLMGSVIALLSVMDFGLSSTIIRYYSKYKTLNDKENMENVLSFSGIIYSIITVLLTLVSIVIYFHLDSIFSRSLTKTELISAEKIFIVLIINLAVSIPSKLFDAVITSNEKFIFLKTVTLIQIVMQPFVVIAVMNKWPNALAMVIVQSIFNFLLIIAKAYYCIRKLKMKLKLHYFDKRLFYEMIKYSFFIFLGAILDQLFWKTNSMILGIFRTTSIVAVYSIALTISNNYMALSTAVTSVFLPKITSLIIQEVPNEVVSDLFIRIGRIQFLLLSCILSGFIIFGRQFIRIWAGEGFSDTYYITLILIIPFTVDLIQNIGLTILQAKNKMVFRSVILFIIAISNTLFAIPLTIYYGAIGCALSAGISFFIGSAIVMNIYYYKVIKIDIMLFWINILKIMIPSIGCMLIGFLLNYIIVGTSAFNLLIKCCIYLAIYIVVVWRFCMNTYEKNMFIFVQYAYRKIYNAIRK